MAKQREVITNPSDDILKYLAENGAIVAPDRDIIYVKVNDRDTDREHWYTMFKDVNAYVAGINDMVKRGDKAGLDFLFDRYDYALGLYERATVREAVAAESTVVTVNGKPLDLMTLPVDKIVRGINGAYDTADVSGKAVPAAFQTARKKLMAAGKVRDMANADVAGKVELVA